jgi:hypothetical protein
MRFWQMRKGILAERFEDFGELLKYVLIHRDDGPDVKTTALKLGMPVKTLYAYCDSSRPFPLERLAELERATGCPEFIEYFTEQLGMVVFEVPKLAGPVDEAVMRRTVEAQREHVEAMQSVMEALSDGKVEAHEVPNMRKEIREAVQSLVALEYAVVSAGEADRLERGS